MTDGHPIFPSDTEPAGIYIHVPFCSTRCNYCAFETGLHSREKEDAYVRSVKTELKLWRCGAAADLLSSELEADTIYFGGGTPSVLQPRRIAELIEACRRSFRISEVAEITVEINPASASPSALALLRDAGVNRVSLGVQSLDDNVLSAMGRAHTARDACNTYEHLRSSGFGNISVDLIAGFPKQSRASLARTLEELILWQPEHVSVYLLEVKEGTILESLIRHGVVQAPDDDEAAAMYEDLCSLLDQGGYVHYEISNFARDGCSSRHNLKYWQDGIFLGIGPAAHGMTGRHRYANVADPGEYCRELETGKLPFGSLTEMTPWTRFKDSLIMGARLVGGLDLERQADRYGVNPEEFIAQTVGDLSDAGLFRIEGKKFVLTPKGRLLSNLIFERWL